MNPPTQAGAATRPKKGNGVTMPSRRGGSGRVLTDVIVDLGFVERDAMDEAVEMATSAGSAAERVLLSTGAITEDELARAVAERFGLDHVDLSVYRVDPDAAKLVTPSAVKRYQAVPVSFSGERTTGRSRACRCTPIRWTSEAAWWTWSTAPVARSSSPKQGGGARPW